MYDTKDIVARMKLPVVAIVGRPNVGKSSLANALARRRVSIVEPTAGTTRDRVSIVCDFDEVFVELVDTGGHGVVDRDDLGEHVERQIGYALQQADIVLLVVDAQHGITPLDRAMADLLRRDSALARRVVVVANKVDEEHQGAVVGEFAGLGFGEPVAASAKSALGLRSLRELIRDRARAFGEGPPPDPALRVAIVGRRNAGKSTFVNALAGEERVIVSEVPGTTRDSVDVRFEKDGQALIAIDTAGLKKKAKLQDDLEYFAYTRALDSIRRADVVLFMIDATSPVGQVDKKLGQLIAEEYKPCAIVVNKWDLAKGQAGVEDYGEYLNKTLPQLSFAPIAFTTAKTGRNVASTIDLATSLLKQSRTRIGTGALNQAVREAMEAGPPPARRGQKRAKVLYATQVSTEPPTVVLFVTDPERVPQQFERFMLNRLRERLPFAEVPIRLVLRGRREAEVAAE